MISENRRHFLTQSVAALVAGAGLVRVASAMAAVDARFPADPANLQPGLEAAHTPRIHLEKAPAAEVAYGKTAAGDFYRVSVQARHEALATSTGRLLGRDRRACGSRERHDLDPRRSPPRRTADTWPT